jgi:hypothetical protein
VNRYALSQEGFHIAAGDIPKGAEHAPVTEKASLKLLEMFLRCWK